MAKLSFLFTALCYGFLFSFGSLSFDTVIPQSCFPSPDLSFPPENMRNGPESGLTFQIRSPLFLDRLTYLLNLYPLS